MSVRMFLDEINICIGRPSRADYPTWYKRVSSGQMKARIEDKGWFSHDEHGIWNSDNWNYSWPLNNTVLNCMGSLIQIIFSMNSYYRTTQSGVGWICWSKSVVNHKFIQIIFFNVKGVIIPKPYIVKNHLYWFFFFLSGFKGNKYLKWLVTEYNIFWRLLVNDFASLKKIPRLLSF